MRRRKNRPPDKGPSRGGKRKKAHSDENQNDVNRLKNSFDGGGCERVLEVDKGFYIAVIITQGQIYTSSVSLEAPANSETFNFAGIMRGGTG